MTIFSNKRPFWVVLLGAIITMSMMNTFAEDTYEEKRQQMLTAIQQMMEMTEPSVGKASLNKRVAEAMFPLSRAK